MSSSSAYSIRYPLSLYGVTECCSGVLRHVLLFDRARNNTPDSPTTETVLLGLATLPPRSAWPHGHEIRRPLVVVGRLYSSVAFLGDT